MYNRYKQMTVDSGLLVPLFFYIKLSIETAIVVFVVLYSKILVFFTNVEIDLSAP